MKNELGDLVLMMLGCTVLFVFLRMSGIFLVKDVKIPTYKDCATPFIDTVDNRPESDKKDGSC